MTGLFDTFMAALGKPRNYFAPGTDMLDFDYYTPTEVQHAIEKVQADRLILWQGHYANYDDSSYTDLFTDPVDCLKAMGHIDADGRPIDVRGDNIHWTLTPMPVYEDWEQARHDKTDWADLQWRTYWAHYVLPLYIWKYENGRRLNAHEQQVLGLRPADEKVRWPR